MDDYNFKPFDKVLVRYYNNSTWSCDLYSHYSKKNEKHCCVGGFVEYCLPYEGNEYLLGTTDSPDQKMWRAKYKHKYWIIQNDGYVVEEEELQDEVDEKRYNIGNYFRTKEEAQVMADCFRAMLKGELL